MQRIAVLGANGRMGLALIRLIAASDDAVLTGALTEPGQATVGRDAGQLAGLDVLGVSLTDQLEVALAGCDMAIDFTVPAATARHAHACVARGCGLVVGTTGLGAAELAALKSAADSIALLYSRNMSIGITVLTELVRQAVRLLGPDFDAEISETHHRAKKDAPSGTALQLGEAVAEARAQKFADVAIYDRSDLSAGRPAQAIGKNAIGFSRFNAALYGSQVHSRERHASPLHIERPCNDFYYFASIHFIILRSFAPTFSIWCSLSSFLTLLKNGRPVSFSLIQSFIPPTLKLITGVPFAKDSNITFGKLSSLDVNNTKSEAE